MFTNPTFWVLVSFVIFFGVLVRFKVPKMVTDILDARAAAIAKEIDEAQRLREEAQALLASYQRKQRDAESEAEEIINQAHAEAARLTEETRKALEAQLARRTQLAEDKIMQAEAQALLEVRALAADAAIAAARRLIAERLSTEKATALIDKSIRDLKGKIH